MDTVYLVSAAIGGTVIVIQFLLMLLGFDGDADVDMDASELAIGDADVGHSEFFDYLSLKSIFAFLTFFGLAGLAVESAGWEPFPFAHLVVALAAGCVAFYIVGAIMVGLSKLESRGNLDLRNAVGETGTVYLTVPAGKAGSGKVTVLVQKRTVQAKAVTAGDALISGHKVQVVGFLSPDTLEVSSL